MTVEEKSPAVLNSPVVFDEFGRYDIVEIADDELDLIGGGGGSVNWICPTVSGNGNCPSNPPPPPQAGQDNDG